MKTLTIICLFSLVSCAHNSDEKAADKSGSCTHMQGSINYSNANCTGTSTTNASHTYCTETTDTATCKSYTSCSNGYYYSDLQLGNTGKNCAAAGFPLACPSGAYNKVATLSQCPF